MARQIEIGLKLEAGAKANIESQIKSIKGKVKVALELDASEISKIRDRLLTQKATIPVKVKLDQTSVGQLKSTIRTTLQDAVKVRIEPENLNAFKSSSISNQIGTIKIKKIDASEAIKGVRTQLQSMLSALSVKNGVNITGLKEFIGTEGVDAANKAVAESANKAVAAMREEAAALKTVKSEAVEFKAAMKSITQISNTTKSSLGKALKLMSAEEQSSMLARFDSLESKKGLIEPGNVAAVRELREEYIALNAEINKNNAAKTTAAAGWKSQLGVLKEQSKAMDKAFRDANKYMAGTKDLESITKRYTDLKREQGKIQSISSGNESDEKRLNEVIASEQRLVAETNKMVAAKKAEAAAAKTAAKEAANANKSQIASLQQVATLSRQIETTLSKNTKLKGTGYESQLRALVSTLDSGDVSKDSFDKIKGQYQTILRDATNAGKMGRSFGTQLKMTYDRLLSYGMISGVFYRIATAARDLYNNVVNIDTAMTQLRKVTDETDSTYEKFFDQVDDRAKSIGATMSDTINASADFARLGYDIDTASKMADAALVYKNVGDNITDISVASQSLTSTIEAFKEFGIEATDAMEVVDRFNEVGNNFAISSDGIGEALQRSASAMAAGNNNLDETIGLITAANTIAQDPKKVGTTLKTISMYLRSSKTELEDAGESTEGMVGSVSKLRDELLALTGGKVDIIGMNGAYKSTYEILKDLSLVWDDLSDLNQANILEKIGGKRNANITSAIIKNFDIAERAMETSANSAGSALRENEKYLESINGKISVLKATWEDFSQAILSSDVVKDAVSGATALLEVFTKIANVFNTPAMLTGGYFGIKGIAKAIKGNGLINYNPFGDFEKNRQTGIERMVKSYQQMRADGISIATSAKGMVSEWWHGTKATQKTENTLNNMLHAQKEVDRLESYNSPEHSKQLASAKEKLEAYKKTNPVIAEYLNKQRELEKAGKKADYSMKGLGSWASKNGKDLGKLGAQTKLAAAGTQILNTAMGALQGIAVAVVIQGITTALSALHKELFTTAEEMQTARAAAQDYGESMKTLEDYKSQIDEQRDIYSDPTSSLDERHAAYEQVSALQSEMIDKYGQEAAGLNMLTASAERYKAAMADIKYKESYDLLYGNNRENLEGLSKAADEMTKIQTNYAQLGWFNKDAVGADVILGDLQKIADKYKEVSLVFTDGVGYQLKIEADAKGTEKVITDLQKDVDSQMSVWKERGYAASEVFGTLADTSNLFSGAYANAAKTISDYGESAEQYFQARIATSEDYSHAADEIMNKEAELKEALSITDEKERYKAVKEVMEGLNSLKIKDLVGKETFGKSKAIDNYLQGMLDDAKDAMSEYTFEFDLQGAATDESVSNTVTDLRDQLDKAFGGMDVGNIIDYWKRFDMKDFEHMTDAQIAALQALDNATSDYGITVDQFLSSLANVGLAYGDISKLAYDAATQLSNATAEFEKAANIVTVDDAISKVGSNRGILDQDTYKSLIAASSDYARAIDYENGYVTLNIEKAHELAKAKADLAMSSISEQKALDTDRYKSNLSELYGLLSQGSEAMSDGVKSRITELQDENRQIAENIGMYNVYMSQLRQMSSAYTAWKQTSESSNSDVTSKDMQSALQFVKDTRKSGQTGVGNVQYQMALKMLVPESEIENVSSYITDTLNRYITEDPKVGVQHWLDDMVKKAKAMEITEDGGYELLSTANLEEAASKLGITRDVMESMIGLANMYADTEIKFYDPDDISNGMNILNDYIAKRQELSEMSEKDEGYAQTKQDVADLARELAELPEDTQLALGIKITDQDGNPITPAQVADEVANGVDEKEYTIEVDADTQNIMSQMDEINNYKAHISTETDVEKINEYNVALEETAKEASKATKEKYQLGFDVDVTDLDSLAKAYAELDKVGDEEGKKEISIMINMMGDAEVHAKIEQLERELAVAEDDKQHEIRVDGDVEGADNKIKQIQQELDILKGTDVGIKVSADELDGLYDKAEAALAEIERLENSDYTPNIKADKIQEQVDLLNKANEEIRKLGGDPVEVPLEYREAEGSKTLQQIGEEAAEGITVPIKVDVAEVGAAMRAALNVSDMMYGDMSVPITADTDSFIKSIRSVANADPVEIKTKADVSGASFDIAELAIKFLGTPIELQTHVDPSEAIESLSGIASAIPPITLTPKIETSSIFNNLSAIASSLALSAAMPPIQAKVEVDSGSAQAALEGLSNSTPPIKLTANVDTSSVYSQVSAAVAAASGQVITLHATVDTSGVSGQINNIKAGAGSVNIKSTVTANNSQAMSALKAVQKYKIANKKFTITASGASNVLSQLRTINSTRLNDKTVTIRTVNITENRSTGPQMAGGTNYAPGGRTLVGEIGPEMVVSHGRYYMVGKHGAEFVNLKRGDIVFNHVDTQRLLAGGSGVRGQALAEGGVAMSSGSINLSKALASSKAKNTTSSSKKKSSTSSSKAAKSLTNTSKKATEDLDKKVEELAKELSKILENFDSAVEVALKSHGNLDDIIKTYKDAQNEIHKQADKYRSMGIDENSKYINDLKSQWYDYKDKIGEAIQKMYEEMFREAENAAKKNEKWMENAIRKDDIIGAQYFLRDWIDALEEQQQILHEEADKLRAQGFTDNSEEVSDLMMKWWDLQDERLEAQISLYDAINERAEATANLYQKLYDTAAGEGNRHNLEIAQSYLLGSLKAQQDVIESQILAYRELGYSDASKEIQELQEKWYDVADAVDEARDKMIDALNDIVDRAHDAVDEIQNVYKVLHDAADEYAENGGYISVDSFQEILKLGPQYMQYLEDENGLLVINDENINKVIKAKTEQLAIENALTYLERIKIALLSNDASTLRNLLTAQTDATDGTWGFVNATASLLKAMGLTDAQYEDMMWNIQSIKTLSENVTTSLDKMAEHGGMTNKEYLRSLEDMRDNVEDFVKYVMDMLEDRLDDQIDKLEDMKDEYEEIIKLKTESLKKTKEENDYQKSLADKIKEAAKIQSQISALAMDDSREARAKRLKLEEQLADIQNEIADKQADYALDRQEDMLDKQEEAYSKEKDAEIEKLKETYSSKEKLYQAALEYINQNQDTVYQEVLDWNYEQGSVLNREITEAWEAAQSALEKYGGTFKSVLEMIQKEIKELKSLTDSFNEDEHHDVVSDVNNVELISTEMEEIQAIINMMEEFSADWINGEQTYSHKNNKDLSNMLEAYGIYTDYDDKTGEWYLKGTKTRLYDAYGTGYTTRNSPGVNEVNEATALEDIKKVAEAMRKNSENWHKVDQATQKKLAQENLDWQEYLMKEYGFAISKDNTGNWVIANDPFTSRTTGRNFYDTYLADGTVKQTTIQEAIKQNPRYAEASRIKSLVSTISSAAENVSKFITDSVTPNSARTALAFDTGAFGSVTPSQEYNISFGDTYITGTAEENIAAHQDITREFTNNILKQLNIKR